MEESTKKKIFFWGVVGILGTAIAASAWYFYSLFNDEEEEAIPTKDKEKITELKEKNEQLSGGKLTAELAIFILTKAQRLVDEKMKQEHPDLDNKRREAIDKEFEYQELLKQTFEYKQENIPKIMSQLITEFNTSEEDFQQALQGITDPREFETLAFKNEKPEFDKEYPTEKQVKDAFKYYFKEFKKGMATLQQSMNSNMAMMQDQMMQSKYYMDMIIIKSKVEDKLHINFGINETQMKFLIYHYKLNKDKDIENSLDTLYKMDGMFEQ